MVSEVCLVSSLVVVAVQVAGTHLSKRAEAAPWSKPVSGKFRRLFYHVPFFLPLSSLCLLSKPSNIVTTQTALNPCEV